MMTARLEATVGSVTFAPCSLDEIISTVDRALEPSASPVTLGYANPHVVTSAVEHPAIEEHLAQCDQVCIDGVGLWLALRAWKFDIERLPAYQAFDALVERQVLRGRMIVIGIEPGVVDQAAASICERCPDLELVATADGFCSDDQVSSVLRNTPADLVVIGAGTPRSEQIATIARDLAPDAVVMHVGAGTLKVYAGVRRHAPSIWSRLGVDWIHRFFTEPHTRDRYRTGIPEFIRLVNAHPHGVQKVTVKGATS